ncbi:MAG TPA: methyltransferase domain-containing protein [Gaiellaceae bacterium]|nr:methyltransferase domain-containing protein [Gaiellaceae bacterium]
MTDRRTALVAAGYDAMADTWETWSAQLSDDPRFEWLTRLTDRLPAGAQVVELGCGNGTRETRELAARYRLTGVDLSAEQLRRARARVPGAAFVQADLTTVDFPPDSLDAVCSFYVLNHVPRELLPQLFDHVLTWLRPGGLFLATLGANDLDEWEGEWLGVPMYFSGHDPARNRELLAGFELVDDEVVTITEPEGPVSFHWILARR